MDINEIKTDIIDQIRKTYRTIKATLSDMLTLDSLNGREADLLEIQLKRVKKQHVGYLILTAISFVTLTMFTFIGLLAEMLESHLSKVTKHSFFFIAVLMILGQNYVMGSENSSHLKILPVDSSRIAVLPNDTSDFWIFPTGLPTVLTKDDFQKIEELLDSTIDNFNAKQNLRYKEMVAKYPKLTVDKDQFVIDFSRYRRQYVAIINQIGDKEVWINCFCNSFQTNNWHSQKIEVEDGGNCFFNLKINLTKRLIYNFSVNGI